MALFNAPAWMMKGGKSGKGRVTDTGLSEEEFKKDKYVITARLDDRKFYRKSLKFEFEFKSYWIPPSFPQDKIDAVDFHHIDTYFLILVNESNGGVNYSNRISLGQTVDFSVENRKFSITIPRRKISDKLIVQLTESAKVYMCFSTPIAMFCAPGTSEPDWRFDIKD